MSTQTQRLTATGKFILQILGKRNTLDAEIARLVITTPDAEGYVIGRSGRGSDYIPDIDLADYSAHEKGVSRRHAALVRYHDAVYVIDLDSANGTFVNGRRLQPGEAAALSPGDMLSLADLNMRILR